MHRMQLPLLSQASQSGIEQGLDVQVLEALLRIYPGWQLTQAVLLHERHPEIQLPEHAAMSVVSKEITNPQKRANIKTAQCFI